MAKKGPALYELIQQQAQRSRPTSVVTRPAVPVKPERAAPPSGPPTGAPPIAHHPAASKPAPSPQTYAGKADTAPMSNPHDSWLSQGKTYRIPAGYIVMAVILLVLLPIVSYSIGFQVSKNQHAAAQTKESLDQYSKINDPTLANNQARSATLPQSNPANNPTTTTNSPAGSSPANTGANRPIDLAAGSTPQNTPAAGPIQGVKLGSGDPDRRTVGLNYYILASFLQTEEADRAVDFFAANGVAVMRQAPNNRGLCTLVALEGFPSGDTQSQRARDYKATLLKLGREYKRNHRGGTDFSDLYLKKHRP